MKIEFRNSTRVNQNFRTEMFFDDIRVAEIHCTPDEFKFFWNSLYNPMADPNVFEVVLDPIAESVII